MDDDLSAAGQRPIVSGQRVSSAKLERARRLRREMTTAEWVMWQLLRANRTAGIHFRRQQVIAGFIVDFYCHAARLVVELDGDVHKQTITYDAARDERLAAQGLLVLRFTNEQVMASRAAVRAQIEAVCGQRIAITPSTDPLS